MSEPLHSIAPARSTSFFGLTRPELADQLVSYADDLGFTKATTFIRTAAEMRALAKDNPFPREPDQKLHVLFCLKKPPRSVLDHTTDTDKLEIGKKELYWAPEGRMTDSELDLKAVEKLLGPNTMRTKGTVDQIAERWFQ